MSYPDHTHYYDEYHQRQNSRPAAQGAVQPMPVTNIIKIKLSFDHEPCRGKEYGIDVEKNTTIQELKNYIKNPQRAEFHIMLK